MGLIPPAVGFVACIVSFIIVRIVHERGLRRLDTETKGRLVEALSDLRMISLLPLAGIAAGWAAMSMFDGLSPSLLLAIYLPVVLVMSGALQVIVYRRMVKMEIDPQYVREYTISRMLVLAALALLVAS